LAVNEKRFENARLELAQPGKKVKNLFWWKNGIKDFVKTRSICCDSFDSEDLQELEINRYDLILQAKKMNRIVWKVCAFML
jgi:hypothetical protein